MKIILYSLLTVHHSLLNYFNYFSEIETLFVRRRGRNLLLSPLDWALIETWQEREVPLHIILSGIERVFDSADKQPSNKRTIKSLLYCKEEIEAQYAEWLERQVGKNNTAKIKDSKFQISDSRLRIQDSPDEIADAPKSSLFSDEAMALHLEKISLEIESAQNSVTGEFQQTLNEVSNRLAELVKLKSHTAENLEESLEKLDALIDKSLLRNFETEKLKVEVEKQIASHKTKMAADVYQRTFDLMLLKRLRENEKIPRLSLFNL